MTKLMATDDRPTLRLDHVDAARGTTARTARLAPLLFGLGLATALPPDAILAPPDVMQPTIRSDTHAILKSADLAAVLDRPIAEVGRARVMLGEVDARLDGLIVSIGVFRVANGAGAGALVSLGVVSPDLTASGSGSATIADLWKLACTALPLHGITGGHLDGFGDDAFLAVYHGTTAQIAWTVGDRLATASVTSLNDNEEWMIAAARSIASVLDRRLR